MVTTYGSFPGVRIEVAGGGITAISIGEEEKLVVFGEGKYANDDTLTTDGSEDGLDAAGNPESPQQINARREADEFFGDGSELANAMRGALGNGANIDFLYGVAPRRYNVIGEVQTTQEGSLDNNTLWEEDVSDEANLSALEVTDTGTGTIDTVRYTYEASITPPTDSETMLVNPLTSDYAADAAPEGDYEFSYKYIDWQTAFEVQDVVSIVNEDETAVFDAVSDSDIVSSSLDAQATSLRQDYQLVNALSGAEPNDNEMVTDDSDNYLRSDARYDTGSYSTANQSVDSDHYFKLAPVRKEDSPETVLGEVGGLFAGNPLSDPIYNDPIDVSGDLEESFTKSRADDMRDENIIPIRQAGSVRVKDNTSTSTSTDWERDFWRRRIADRVILIGKQVGDAIIGRINDEQTRSAAGRLIRAELRQLVDDRLLKPNTSDEQRWFVDVYPSSTDPNQVKIDIGFTPFGIVKRVEETLIINT